MKRALRVVGLFSRRRLVAVLLVVGLSLGDLNWAGAATADWTALSTTIFRSVGEVPGTSVTAIAQDGAGYLWVGGQSGLSRYDGYRFRAYRADPQSPDAIHDTNINVLHTDRRGRLWIGTSVGGLARYDPAGDRFVSYRAGVHGLSSDSVGSLADDAGGVWIGSSAGLDYRSDASGDFTHFHHDRRPGALPDDAISALFVDDAGTLWVGTGSGLVRRDAASGHFVPVALPTAAGKVPVAASIIEDSVGRIWIGTDENGLFVMRRSERAAHAAQVGSAADAALLAATSIAAMSEVRPGHMWIGTGSHGIAALDVAARRVTWIRNDPAIATSLPQDIVLAMLRDRSGLVWVGNLSGLRRSDPRQTAIATVVVGSNRANGIAESDVTMIAASGNERAWLGFPDGGIDIVDATLGRVRSLRPDRGRPQQSLPPSIIRALAGFAHGPMYIGTRAGLFEISASGEGLRHIPLPGGGTQRVNSLAVIDDVLWIGTNGRGVWRLDRGSGTPRRVACTGLSSAQITVVAPAARGQLWVGTFAGLNLLDIRAGRAHAITSDDRAPGHAALGFIASLLSDRMGRLWVGTFGEGIQIVDHVRSDGRAEITGLSARDGLPNVNVDALLADRQGRIWVATDDGMAQIDPTTRAVHPLHRADGVEFSNYYAGAAAMLGNGDLLFGSTGGLTIIRPALVRDWTDVPPVVATDIRVGGAPVTPPLVNGATAAPIDISPDANSLAVEIAALDFSAPEQNEYAYRLDGYDRAWNETDASRRLAAYTNLPPGTYTLEFRGTNRDGAWSPVSMLSIRVHPAWYQTIVFRLFAIVLALAVIAGMIRIRTAYLLRREKALQQLVDQRTTELRETARELSERRAELEEMAYRDVLTNVANRRMFGRQVARFLTKANAESRSFALVLLDLDRFKSINDSFGHDAGDAVIVEAARRLRSVVRSDDCVARLGGDEFAILIDSDDDDSDFSGVCERIVASLALPVNFNGTALRTSASIGIAMFPAHGRTADDLYKSADIALYEAKRAGRNTWRRAGYAPSEPRTVNPSMRL